MPEPILPGAAIGVLGSGQLGRMLALAARPMGYSVHVLSPRPSGTPTGRVAAREVTAEYTDLEAVRELASGVSAVTFEFENVPARAAEAAARLVPVRPAGRVLHVAQNRLREKTFLAEHGFPVTPFRAIHGRSGLFRAVEELGAPAVLKTAGFGYDGKGQALIEAPGGADDAWRALFPLREEGAAVLEAFVEFEREVSVVEWTATSSTTDRSTTITGTTSWTSPSPPLRSPAPSPPGPWSSPGTSSTPWASWGSCASRCSSAGTAR